MRYFRRAGVVLVMLGLAGLGLIWWLLGQYTEPRLMSLPYPQFATAELEALRDRVGDFQQAVRAQQPTTNLVLGNDEINALIASEPQFRTLRNRIYVQNEGSGLKGWISIPLGQLGLRWFKTRYINGLAGFGVVVTNGVLVLTVERLSVKGRPVPEWLMKQVRKQNLAAESNKDPRVSIAAEHLETIRVTDGRLEIVPKRD